MTGRHQPKRPVVPAGSRPARPKTPPPSAPSVPPTDISAEPWYSTLPLAQQQELTSLTAIFEGLDVRIGDDSCPKLRLPIDLGLDTPAVLTIRLPAQYPQERPAVAVHHASLAAATLKELALKLEEDTQVFLGEAMVYQLHSAAKDALSALPVAEMSQYFVWCRPCADRLAGKGLPRYPQPAEQVCASSMHLRDQVYRCLTCGSADVRWLSCIRRNIEDPCSWCCCPENPCIALRCGERVCTECITRAVTTAVGERALQPLHGQNHAAYTVHCPAHPSVNIFAEPMLAHLLDDVTRERFLQFAFEEGALAAGLVECPLPGCSNAMFWPTVLGHFPQCPMCRGFFCRTCKSRASGCTCPTLLPDEVRAVPPGMGLPPGPYERASQARDLLEPVSQRQNATPLLVRHSGSTCILTILPDSTLGDVRRAIMSRWCIFPSVQMLFLAGRLLQDDQALMVDFLQVFTTVHLAIRTFQDPHASQHLKLRWKLRHQHISNNMVAAVARQCPNRNCRKPVVHYHNHGCHHITGCCGVQWCYNCIRPSPCDCRLFCSEACDCPICPDCQPDLPCAICSGCIQCRPDLN